MPSFAPPPPPLATTVAVSCSRVIASNIELMNNDLEIKNEAVMALSEVLFRHLLGGNGRTTNTSLEPAEIFVILDHFLNISV
jgi:hypothetical protein